MHYIMDNSFLTGCEQVDAQHLQLFEAINSLLDACEGGADREALKKSLNFLSDYTVKHFFDEEQILKKHGFSDFAQHHGFHDAFKKTVRDFEHEFILKGVSDALIQGVQDKIGKWLIEHIKGQDFRWAKELKNKAPDLFSAKPINLSVSSAATATTVSTTRTVAPKSAPPPPVVSAAVKDQSRAAGIQIKMTSLSSAVVFASIAIMFLLGALNTGWLVRVAAAAALLLFAIVCNYGFIKVLVINPLNKINGTLQKAESGDIDQRLSPSAVDEISGIAVHIDVLLENLKRLVLLIRNESESTGGIDEELFRGSTKAVETMNQIDSDIQLTRERINAQSESITAAGEALGKISENIGRLNSEIEAQTESAARSSAAVEEMLTSIDSVSRVSRINSENISRLAEASDAGRTSLQVVANDLREIARESEGLLEINSVLSNIASQTNLLSMNAAIEAAHAGETGKGFAVVADEIRKLAESSGEQSKTISTVLKKIKDSITRISSAAGAVLDKFGAIEMDVKTVSGQEEQIRGAMEEQNSGGRRIQEAISRLNEITRAVKSAAKQMRADSDELISMEQNLGKSAAGITDKMTSMANRADEVRGVLTRINAVSGKGGNTSVLKDAVSHFMVNAKH